MIWLFSIGYILCGLLVTLPRLDRVIVEGKDFSNKHPSVQPFIGMLIVWIVAVIGWLPFMIIADLQVRNERAARRKQRND